MPMFYIFAINALGSQSLCFWTPCFIFVDAYLHDYVLFLVCFAGEEKEMNACRLKEIMFLEMFHSLRAHPCEKKKITRIVLSLTDIN